MLKELNTESVVFSMIYMGLPLLGCLLMLVACRRTAPPQPFCDNGLTGGRGGVSLECLGSDTFFIDASFVPPAFFAGAFEIKGEEYFGVTNLQQGNMIHFISFEDHSKRIDIPLEPLAIGGVRTFDVDGSDLYVYMRGVPDSSQLHVLSLDGNYVKGIHYSQYFTFDEDTDDDTKDTQHIYAPQDSPLQFDGGRLYFSVNHSLPSKEDSMIGYIDLATQELKQLPVRYPEGYFDNEVGGNISYYLANVLADSPYCYVSFAASGDISRWPTAGGVVEQKLVASKYLPKLNAPPINYSPDAYSAYGDAALLELKNGRYGKIVKLGNTNLLVRLISHPDENAQVQSFVKNRPGSLMLLDADLNLIGETGIISGIAPGGIFARTDGTLYLQDMRATDDSLFDGGYLVFQKLKFTAKSNDN
jgi:hypothetical protein